MKRLMLSAAVVWGIGFSQLSSATMTVTPESPWGVDNGTVYYAVDPFSGGAFSGNSGGSNAVFMDTGAGYRFLDTTLGVSAGSLSETNLVKLTITTDQTITTTGGQQPVIAIVMKDVSNAERFVPIAWTGGSACSDSNCQGLTTISGKSYYLSAKFFAPGTLQIGLYPRDLCTGYFGQQSTSAAGCSSGDVVPGKTSGTNLASRLVLSIRIYNAANSTNTTQPATGDTAVETSALNLSFQADGPSISTCPDLNSIYFPGDSEIFVAPSSQSIIAHDGATAGSDLASTNRAPISALVTVAKKGSGIDPDDSSIFRSNSDIVSVQPLTALSPVSGFENGSFYGVGFMFRDAAGLIASNDCFLKNVKTSDIQGFLKTSKCFIATAAFRSQESAPVKLLRLFRNQKLKPTRLGRAFVSLYEEFSPPLAEWIVDHPESRFLALVALTPVEALAWVALKPGSALLFKGLFGFAIVLLGVTSMLRIRGFRERVHP